TVRVVMTRAAQDFVGPLTFQALTGERVRTDLLDTEAEAAMGHIELARWAELVLVAPASADTLARLAGGRADDLLATICLATQAPLAVAPAMNRVMWANAAAQANVETLGSRGITVLEPGTGEQACGEVGAGRMQEPVDLVTAAEVLLGPRLLDGVRTVITAGPTREALDPVRYLSNHSSGRMGFAIADAAARAGAEVTLIAGPVAHATPAGVTRIDVESAQQMHTAVMDRVAVCDLFIATAAVSDYRPVDSAPSKIKKDGAGGRSLALTTNPDILAEVCARQPRPFTVAFAAETDAVAEHAREKRQKKGADMICANAVGHDRGFGDVETALQVFWDEGERELGPGRKGALARELIELIAARRSAAAALVTARVQ
ncbi:MAG: bifunctional phosphopantothenoylcysteine decarboxylase/phosphopantothenate--cysteine ligase CoaBC, partial [Halofilum sp. (in: g-proteobacteria)]